MRALTALAAALRAEGGLIAEALAAPDGDDRHAARVADGPRAAAAPDDYALVVAAVREGYLLHYGRGRVVRTDDDLALLAGDRLYALALARLAERGDLAAVAELADLISLCAQAAAEGRDEIADAAWDAAAAALAAGPTPAHARAKELARAGAPDALPALRASALAPDS